MTKNHYNIASLSMFRYAAKFLKGRDAGTVRRGNVCKAFALVYSDRALTGYKVRAA